MTREGTLLRLRVELVQEVGLVGDEEQHLGRDRVGRTPGEPVLGVDPDLEVDEAAAERGRHAVDDAAVGFAVAAGDERRALAAGRMPLLTGYGGGDSVFERVLAIGRRITRVVPGIGRIVETRIVRSGAGKDARGSN